MADCCHSDYRKVFRTAEGFKDLKRYDKRGLHGSESTIAELVRELSLPDATLIEVGAGAGVLHVDLLATGASSATAVDISAGWTASAQVLLEQKRLSDRVTRVVGDFVEQADDIAEADVVLLHRVICCYPDWVELVDAAAQHARRAVVFTVPRQNLFARLVLLSFNVWLGIQRCGFEAFLHPVDEILDRFVTRGFTVTAEVPTVAWATYRLERE